MAEAEKRLTGGCACGAVSYVSKEAFQHLDFCYCHTCQRVSGAPFVAWSGVSREALTWRGPISYIRLSELATRGFCPQCGGTLLMQYDCYPNKTHVAAATIIQSDWGIPKPGVHIFVKDKPLWFRLSDDGLPRFNEFDDEFPEVLRLYQESEHSKTL